MPEFDQEYNLEDKPDTTGNDPVGGGDKNPSEDATKNLLLKVVRTLLNPVEGWKAIKRTRLSPQKFNPKTLFPIAGVVSISQLVGDLVWTDRTLSESIPGAISAFCAFFFGYFAAILFAKLLMPKPCRNVADSDFGKNFIAAAMTTFAIFYALIQLLPMMQPILVFLPLWTIFSISRGVRFLQIPADMTTRVATIMSVVVIGAPLAIDWLVSLIL